MLAYFIQNPSTLTTHHRLWISIRKIRLKKTFLTKACLPKPTKRHGVVTKSWEIVNNNSAPNNVAADRVQCTNVVGKKKQMQNKTKIKNLQNGQHFFFFFFFFFLN